MESTRELLIKVFRSYWPVLIASVALGLLLPAQSFALAMVALLMVFTFRKSREWKDPWPFRLMAAGLGLRLALILLKFAGYKWLGISIGIFGDSRMHLAAAEMAKGVLNGDLILGSNRGTIRLVPDGYGYSITHWLYGAIYQLFGSSPFLLHILNGLYTCITGLLIYLIVIRICSHKPSARLAMGLTLFMPSQIMWSVDFLKEPLIQLYIALILYLFVDVVVRKKWRYLLLLGFLWYPLGHLRNSFHILMLGSLAVGAFFAFTRRFKYPVIFLSIIVGAAAIKMGPDGLNKRLDGLKSFIVLKQIGFLTTEGSSYKFIPDRFDVDHRAPVMTNRELTVTVARAIGYYLLCPFPFKMVSLNKLPALPQMLVWYFLLFVCFIPGSLYLLRYHFRSSAILFAYLAIFTTVMALVTGNEGTAFRQRDVLTIIYFIPISVGFYNIKGWLGTLLARRVQVRVPGQAGSQVSDGN